MRFRYALNGLSQGFEARRQRFRTEGSKSNGKAVEVDGNEKPLGRNVDVQALSRHLHMKLDEIDFREKLQPNLGATTR